MKSSRGKDPINGVAKTPKKVQGKLARDRQKDPVEVKRNALLHLFGLKEIVEFTPNL